LNRIRYDDDTFEKEDDTTGNETYEMDQFESDTQVIQETNMPTVWGGDAASLFGKQNGGGNGGKESGKGEKKESEEKKVAGVVSKTDSVIGKLGGSFDAEIEKDAAAADSKFTDATAADKSAEAPADKDSSSSSTAAQSAPLTITVGGSAPGAQNGVVVNSPTDVFENNESGSGILKEHGVSSKDSAGVGGEKKKKKKARIRDSHDDPNSEKKRRRRNRSRGGNLILDST
jgi:hypothetical protein